ncbi:hypothetical protein [Achromobacter sp. 2789STDY5608628]|uniref:hypothetical protein n=1 Tax=Achromobacter sp. 2789STDY5608628 TaxID=1806493 RepID=UPI0006BF7CD5|nr:hypothetical protein [Achromobacter sp. 2789STDY5608628]CUJ79678.1 Uncharacterised protein [Achromobacter sp. 2789STDY5608628]
MAEPIMPVDYLYGTKVVNIGDLRVARGKSQRPLSVCRHPRLVYDTSERRVYCQDCESDVAPFDAFLQLVERHHHLDAKAEKLREDAAHTVISRAAKRMDAAWRSKTMAPLCPHCTKAIMPEDVVNGVGMTSKEWEVRRRAARAATDKKEM